MLQLLICSDVHTYTDNIRLALHKLDRTDAVLIAGDLEAEESEVLKAVGSVPCYAVCGNNDYYINTEYPEELLIDIAGRSPLSGDDSNPADDTLQRTARLERFPRIEKVTELKYSSLPAGYNSVHPFIRKIAPRSLMDKIAGDKRGPAISHRILMTHGKEYNVPATDLLSRRADMWDADIVIFGHTHTFAEIREKNGKRLFLNPGCLVGDPKSKIRKWGIYEICSFSVLKIGLDGEISFQHFFI